jgi:hypothetical protein
LLPLPAAAYVSSGRRGHAPLRPDARFSRDAGGSARSTCVQACRGYLLYRRPEGLTVYAWASDKADQVRCLLCRQDCEDRWGLSTACIRLRTMSLEGGRDSYSKQQAGRDTVVALSPWRACACHDDEGAPPTRLNLAAVCCRHSLQDVAPYAGDDVRGRTHCYRAAQSTGALPLSAQDG